MKSITPSITSRKETGCGTLYTILQYNETYNPTRIQITLGKAGGCAACQLQAIQNLVNEHLKRGEDISFLYDKKYDNSLMGIRCPNLQKEDEGQIEHEDEGYNLSCPDVIAKSIRRLMSELAKIKKDEEPKKKDEKK